MGTDWILDSGYLPHAVIRLGIRRQLRDRLLSLEASGLSATVEAKMAYLEGLRWQPIAIETSMANK